MAQSALLAEVRCSTAAPRGEQITSGVELLCVTQGRLEGLEHISSLLRLRVYVYVCVCMCGIEKTRERMRE